MNALSGGDGVKCLPLHDEKPPCGVNSHRFADNLAFCDRPAKLCANNLTERRTQRTIPHQNQLRRCCSEAAQNPFQQIIATDVHRCLLGHGRRCLQGAGRKIHSNPHDGTRIDPIDENPSNLPLTH